MFNFKKKKNPGSPRREDLDDNRIPEHIAIIMDGNGRWAKARKMPRSMGHRAGVETIRSVVKECDRLGVKYLTVYAFSTENWKRPKEEVDALMQLLVEYLRRELEELHQNRVVIRILGDLEKLPERVQEEIRTAVARTRDNDGLQFNIALNYGGRQEIIQGIHELLEDVASGKVEKTEITEELFKDYLYTHGMPDPELIIRPSGEHRLSNFLLYQSAYSELWFSDIHWPDFREEHLQEAIRDYQRRNRRFGGVK